LYISASTTATAEATLNTVLLTIGSYVSMSGANIPVMTGVPQKLLSLPTVVPTSEPYVIGTSRVNYGYQYFVFNSLVPNTNFALDLAIKGFIGGQVSDFNMGVYVNGVFTSNILITSPNSGANNPFDVSVITLNRTYALNDIVFLTATPIGASLAVSLTTGDLTFRSDYIKVRALRRLPYLALSGIPNLAATTTEAGAPYNVELSPRVMYNNWAQYIGSTFLDQVTGPMSWQSLSKNPYLRRTLPDGAVIIENADAPIDSTNRLFYPITVELQAAIPLGFAKLMSSVVNAHVHFTFLGHDFYFFPGHLSQQPALNESQTLSGLISPKTNLLNFVNITQFKQPDMSPNSCGVSPSSSVQFVPINQVLNPLYHTYDADLFLFREQIKGWSDQRGYSQPVQIGDTLTLQFFTRDLDPIYYRVFDCDGNLYRGPQNLDTIPSAAVIDPYILWQYFVDTQDWDEGCYTLIVSSPTRGDLFVSECQSVRADQAGTLLFEARNSFNTQATIFDGGTPFAWKMRVEGFYDNRTKQQYLARTYTDQGQDLLQLNAVTFETMQLTTTVGVPDYVTKKMLRYLLMDSTTIDGRGFGLEEGADFEEVFTPGVPRKLQSVEIRPSRNRDMIGSVGGELDTDNSLIVTVSPGAFLPNVTNASGTTDNEVIEITVNN
jgi:hypothetical protein